MVVVYLHIFPFLCARHQGALGRIARARSLPVRDVRLSALLPHNGPGVLRRKAGDLGYFLSLHFSFLSLFAGFISVHTEHRNAFCDFFPKLL